MVDISKMTMPAIVGGIVAGILSGIPLIGALCCLWFIAGGAIAAYMLIGNVGKIELTDGAIVGALSGVVAGIIAGILGIIVSILFPVDLSGIFGDVPGMGIDTTVILAAGIIGIVIDIIFGAIFGAIGGVIVAKLKE